MAQARMFTPFRKSPFYDPSCEPFLAPEVKSVQGNGNREVIDLTSDDPDNEFKEDQVASTIKSSRTHLTAEQRKFLIKHGRCSINSEKRKLEIYLGKDSYFSFTPSEAELLLVDGKLEEKIKLSQNMKNASTQEPSQAVRMSK